MPQFTVRDMGTRRVGRRLAELHSTHDWMVWNGWDDEPVHTHSNREDAERCARIFQTAREQAEALKAREHGHDD